MSNANQGAPAVNTPAQALDLAGYTEVVIEKTVEIEGHVYRRGTRHTVDADTLKALRDGGSIPPAPAA